MSYVNLTSAKKTCRDCGETKLVTAFHVSRKSPGGRWPMCAKCRNTQNRAMSIKCRRCGVTKRRSAYDYHATTRTGLRAICHDCLVKKATRNSQRPGYSRGSWRSMDFDTECAKLIAEYNLDPSVIVPTIERAAEAYANRDNNPSAYDILIDAGLSAPYRRASSKLTHQALAWPGPGTDAEHIEYPLGWLVTLRGKQLQAEQRRKVA